MVSLMSKLVEIKTNESNIFMETSISEVTGTVLQPGIRRGVDKKLSELLDVIQPVTESIVESVDKLTKKPDTVSAEFGLSVTEEGNIFVVRNSAEASLIVTLKWGK